MQDVTSLLKQLKRPRLIVRAARIGARDYVRKPHLQRLLGYGDLPRPALAVLKLMELERALEDGRQSNEAAYSYGQHVDVLIALIGEANLLHCLQIADKKEAAQKDRP